MPSVHTHFSASDLDVASLARYLEGLNPAERIRQVRSLSRSEQAKLFDASDGVLPMALGDLVPPSTAALREVVHYGRNSLPIFRVFEKRFCRPEGDPAPAELWGYNEHPTRWATGPGYFVARDHGQGEVLLDYVAVPPARPEAWPPIRPNYSPRGRFVYGGTQDVLRGVADGVCVGRAARGGKPMDNWFVLCRASSGGA